VDPARATGAGGRRRGASADPCARIRPAGGRPTLARAHGSRTEAQTAAPRARNAAPDLLALACSVIVLLAAQGCVTGHLLDAARRIERPAAYREASLDGDRLLLRYATLVTDDDGRPLGRAARRVAIAVADLRRADVPVERFPVRHLPDAGPLPGRPLALTTGNGPAGGSVLDVEQDPDGRPFRVVLDDAGSGAPGAFYPAALTTRRTALWAYPLLPLSVAIDVATNPVLMFFAPAVIVFAD